MFNANDASEALEVAGIDISNERYTVEDVATGMNVESEHGKRSPDLDVTGDDPVITAKTALAHLRESLTTTTGSKSWSVEQKRPGSLRTSERPARSSESQNRPPETAADMGG